MPRLPKDIVDSALYLYASKEDALARKDTGGTAFLLSMTSERHSEITYFYVVSNWHVAVRDGHSVLGLNKLDGGTDAYELGPEDWIFDPSGDDVAVALVRLRFDLHRVNPIPVGLIYSRAQMLAPDPEGIGLGDDVFMMGRFIDSEYLAANSPVMRFGHVSAVMAQVQQPGRGFRESYCLDMHSRGGYSGSPVFAYRTPGTNLARTYLSGGVPEIKETLLLLLGVHFGQFEETLKISVGGTINGYSGMTGAVPAWKIRELIDGDALKQQRRIFDDEWTEKFRQEGRPPLEE